MVQLKNVFSFIQQDVPHLIVGDFNSLDSTDYTQQEWNTITHERERNEWEEPMSLVLSEMKKRGYVDARKIAVSVEGDLATCWANTRIDFVFLSESLRTTFPTMQVSTCAHIPSEASDHVPVLVDLLIVPVQDG